MFWLKNKNFGKLHICIGRNDDILNRIADGWQKKRSVRFDKVPGQIFASARINQFFIDIDWM